MCSSNIWFTPPKAIRFLWTSLVLQMFIWFFVHSLISNMSLSCTISYSLMSLMRLCWCLSIPSGFFSDLFRIAIHWISHEQVVSILAFSLHVWYIVACTWPGSGSKHGFQKPFIDVSPPTGVDFSCLIHCFPVLCQGVVLSKSPCNYL